jgi:hypothetical protein
VKQIHKHHRMKKEIQVFCKKIVVIFNNTEHTPVYFLRYEQKPVCTNWPKHERNLITLIFFHSYIHEKILHEY